MISHHRHSHGPCSTAMLATVALLATLHGACATQVQQSVATPAPRGPVAAGGMITADRVALELGTTWSPTTGQTAEAGHLVLDHVMRTRGIVRTGPIEIGGSLEIGPNAAGTPVNSQVATDGYDAAAAVMLGLQLRGVIAESEMFAFGALGEMELAILPYHEVTTSQVVSSGTQLDSMFRAGPWVAFRPVSALTLTAGSVAGFHPHFVPRYQASAGHDPDARKQAGVLTLFAGLSATAGPVTFVGQLSGHVVGTPAWIDTNPLSADFAVRFDLAEI